MFHSKKGNHEKDYCLLLFTASIIICMEKSSSKYITFNVIIDDLATHFSMYNAPVKHFELVK